jgi:ABC-type branched-subunit amino acid transport system ATPase component
VSDAGLQTQDVTVRFGGSVVLNGVGVDAPLGRLTGLLGPNGAGKTTLFNVCSGLLRPTSGTVRLFGDDVSHVGPAHRARLGLGRTFQRMELFDSMTVDENLVVATEARLVGARPQRQLFATAAERTQTREAVDGAIEACGLGPVQHELAGTLSTGWRRLVELARACAAGFRLLLLDEPSSGLDGEETERLGQIIRGLVDERGTGILLVEHDMTLVMDVCEHLFVLDFGTLVFDGTPAAAQTSDVVRAAYLGSESGLEAAEHEHEAAEVGSA